MALMYPWATKEYLLWEMTIGQIILYHNKGMSIRNGDSPSKKQGLANMSADELRQFRAETLGIDSEEAKREELRRKYGDIDG